MKICISCESTVDLTKELVIENDIRVVPFSVALGDKIGYDGEITTHEIYEFVEKKKTLPKTSAVNAFQYEEHFKKIFSEGYEAIIHISLSSELSSAYQNACNVASEMKNVYVIDSRSLSTGIALLAFYAKDLVAEGLKPEEIVKKVEARIPHLEVSFVLNTLEYLYKGGRCTAVQRFAAMILRIKPQIIVKDGKMGPGDSFRGKNSDVVRQYCESILSKFKTPDKTRVFLTHSDASSDMIETARTILEKAGFKKIYITIAGATITSHCGPRCLGILYLNDGK